MTIELRRALLLSLATSFLFAVPRLPAQSDDTPLNPTDILPRVGGEFGLSSGWQTGSYIARCGTFTKGSRVSPLIAIAYDRTYGRKFRFEGLLGVQGRGVSSSYNSSENVVLQTPGGPARAAVDFENVGTLSATYLFVLPSMKFYITRGFYVGAGVSAGLLLGASTQYTKNIISRTVVVDDLGLSEVYYPSEESSDAYSKVFPEESREDASGIAVDAVAYVGAEIPFGSRLAIGPRIAYILPVTTVLVSPDLKLNALQFLIGARLSL